jgi:alginate O-acetyltransferase complex protein AlgI
MAFSSPLFLFVFLPAVLALYFLLPGLRWRNGLLLFASLSFYSWGEGVFVLLLLFSIAANHTLALIVARLRGEPAAKAVVAVAVAVNLALLGAFKYAGFFTRGLNDVLDLVGVDALPVPDLHLPIGLSFFTFQAMSYVIDVYRGQGKAQRNPIQTALYISLFPQLILGPILRYRHISRQLTDRTHTWTGFVEGIGRFSVGLAKKVLIADTLAITSDRIFAGPADELTAAVAWIGAVCFTLQLYFDFSGYSDMAIGLGRMFGFRYRENFNYPLVARSRSEFFRRWHVSFFTWMRDYVYAPMCEKGCSRWRRHLNLVIVWLLAGLWHGAAPTFVVWGLVSGLWIVLERVWLLAKIRRLWRPFQHAYGLGLSIAGMVVFRSTSLEEAVVMLGAMVGASDASGEIFRAAMFFDLELIIALAVGIVAATPVAPALRDRLDGRLQSLGPVWQHRLGDVRLATLGATWVAMLFACALSAAARTYTPFVYFQF